MAPRVSVLIAAYNSAAYVGDALASVLAQTFEDREVILADDASTNDHTVATARGSFGDHVRIVTASVNSGRPAATRALALQHARGELVRHLPWTPTTFGPRRICKRSRTCWTVSALARPAGSRGHL